MKFAPSAPTRPTMRHWELCLACFKAVLYYVDFEMNNSLKNTYELLHDKWKLWVRVHLAGRWFYTDYLQLSTVVELLNQKNLICAIHNQKH